ncbi:MmcQ/YjbR family DNA-binding protein [Billgrantia azerbaijanica]|nr:MmcQ/YjbR family DNA-binding protein [Halomonas azerbaijanica]
MTIDADFRTIALAFPGAVEHAHARHPDFRVNGKVFASLGDPDEAWGTVMLTPEEQQHFIATAPESFQPAPGPAGKQGETRVHLATTDHHQLRDALIAAWRGKTPKRMRDQFHEHE